MKMNKTMFPSCNVCFVTKTDNQDKITPFSIVPTFQVGKDVTHIDSIFSRIPEIITKVAICTIYGDPMYLIEGTPIQQHHTNIDSFSEPSDPKIYLLNSTIWTLYTNTVPNKLTTIGFGLHCHTPADLVQPKISLTLSLSGIYQK